MKNFTAIYKIVEVEDELIEKVVAVFNKNNGVVLIRVNSDSFDEDLNSWKVDEWLFKNWLIDNSDAKTLIVQDKEDKNLSYQISLYDAKIKSLKKNGFYYIPLGFFSTERAPKRFVVKIDCSMEPQNNEQENDIFSFL